MNKQLIKQISFALVIGIICVLYGTKPNYNWDCLPYAATVLKIDGLNLSDLHSKTYTLAKKELTSESYEQLTTGGKYREEIANNSKGFIEQLPFYYIKPLYILFILIFFKLGVPLFLSTALPSLISFFIISVITFFLLSRKYNFIISSGITLLLMLFHAFSDVARESSPDTLSSLFLIGTIFSFLNKKTWQVTLLLTLAILTRPDNIIFGGIFLCLSFYKKSFTVKQVILGFVCIGLAYITPKVFIDHYSWKTLFYHSFIEHLTYPNTDNSDFSLLEYCFIIIKNGFKELKVSLLPLICIPFIFKQVRQSFSKKSIVILITIAATVIVRYLLFPVLTNRFMFAFYIATIIILLTDLKIGGTE